MTNETLERANKLRKEIEFTEKRLSNLEPLSKSTSDLFISSYNDQSVMIPPELRDIVCLLLRDHYTAQLHDLTADLERL